jgi:cobalt-zinc-cadmium resistance protein CzcA
MLDAIIRWSLGNRLLVLLAVALFAVGGAFSLQFLPLDAFPDTTPVQVQINTISPGLAPEQVEHEVTVPVELALSGMPGLSRMRSISKFGLSQVVVTFADGTDIYRARQLVNERLATADRGDGMPTPQMGPIATGLGEVFHYVVTSKTQSPMDLRVLQDWTLKPALRTVSGTAEINGWGGDLKQYQVRLDPWRMLKHRVPFTQVEDALRTNNADVGGGVLRGSGESMLVHGVGRLTTVGQVGDIVVAAGRDGVPVHVLDLAGVEVGTAQRMGAVTYQGRGEAVLGLGFMLMGENSREVTARLKEKFQQAKKTLPPEVEARVVYDRTELVDQVLDTVRKNLFEGGLLVIAVLFVFLGNLRAGLIVACAIPLSMLFAFCGMLRFGIAGSLLSLGAIDFGLVVDSSVVLVENVVRHLSHSQVDERTRLEMVRDAALEVRKPTLFGELIIMIVYLPILTLEGVEGKLFRPMALTVIFALAGSMILSLTLMPVLASLLLPRKMKDRDPWIVDLARWLYAPLLRLSLRFGIPTLILTVAAMLMAGMMARNLGSEFVPKLSEGALVLGIMRLPGTSIEEATEINTRMEKLLLAHFPDEVRHVWARCGTAEVATDPMGPEETDFFISLHPREKWTQAKTQDELVDKIKKVYEDIPGQRINYTQPIEQRLEEMVSGVRTNVALLIYGDDFDELGAAAERAAKVLGSIPGNADLAVDLLSGQPVLRIVPKQDQLARYGVPARRVLDLVEALAGKPVGQVVEGDLRFPLVIRLPDRYRNDPASIEAMTVQTSQGEQLPLSRLAKVEVIEAPPKVSREQGRRRIAVQCNVRDRDLGSFIAEARPKVEAALQLPAGGRYYHEWGGTFENLDRARTRLMIVVPLALLLVFVLVYLTYYRLSDVFLVLTGIPFACVGGVLALWLRQMPFSISAAVGFIALAGVSVLNSMVLVTFIRQLRAKGFSHEAAIEGAALIRLRPVLMTALVASLGFLPMALSTGVGAEVQRPLATVVIGGVVSSTLLTLLVLPVLYRYFGPRAVVEEKAA